MPQLSKSQRTIRIYSAKLGVSPTVGGIKAQQQTAYDYFIFNT